MFHGRRRLAWINLLGNWIVATALPWLVAGVSVSEAELRSRIGADVGAWCRGASDPLRATWAQSNSRWREAELAARAARRRRLVTGIDRVAERQDLATPLVGRLP